MLLTRENVWICHKAGLDVIWAACHMMTKEQRQEFILFTVRQRQPHLVELFTSIGLKEHATQIKNLRFDTSKEAQAAIPILNAARAAARDTMGAARTATDARDAAWDDWDTAWAAWTAARNSWGILDATDAAREQQIEWCIAQMARG